MFSVVIFIWVGMKYILLDTKSTTVITTSKTVDFRSLTIKFMLIVSHIVFGTGSGYNFPRGKCQIGLVYKQKSHILIY